MNILILVLFIVATILFAIETFRTKSLVAAGLTCLALAFALGAAGPAGLK